MKKIIVYTVLFGDYDDIDHLNIWDYSEEYDTYIITDKRRKSIIKSAFKQIIAPKIFVNNAYNSRYYKFNPFDVVSGDEYFYFDASRKISSVVVDNVIKVSIDRKADIIHFRHPKNDSFIDEVGDCYKRGKVDANQFMDLQKVNEEFGCLLSKGVLTENSFLYFKKSYRVRSYFASILGLYVNFLKRDQLASMIVSTYVARFNLVVIYLQYEDVDYVNKYRKHKKKKLTLIQLIKNKARMLWK